MSSSFIERFHDNSTYTPPANSLVLKAIDMHTGGEPLRVITQGYPDIPADSLLEYRRKLKQDYDHLRTALMFEPRGHADMYGALVLPPFDNKADCSVIFMHNEGYSTMCGHAVIAIMTLAMEMNWVEVTDGKASMVIEAPCGLIAAKGEIINGKIQASFHCVPSFVTALNQTVHVPSLGKEIQYDLAYGGAFYVYVDAAQFNIPLVGANQQQLSELGEAIKKAVTDSCNDYKHPFSEDLSFIYGTIFVGEALEGNDSRNVCIFADGEVDRSPTGSGVSGRMALHHAKGELSLGEGLSIESIIGSVFRAEVAELTEYGPHQAVIPKVIGDAYVCGQNEFIIQADDKLKHGFLLR